MPKPRPTPEATVRAVDALIDRILEELRSPANPEALDEIRAAFRKKVPLRLRSYAASVMLLEMAARSGPSRGEKKQSGKKPGQARPEKKQRIANDNPPVSRNRDRAPSEPVEPRIEEARPRLQGEGTTIFFGMGKRQRLYPRILLRILTEEGQLDFAEIGDIRAFDNYCFADIAVDKAEAVIAALDGIEFRNRPLPVNKARRRGEAAPIEEGIPALIDDTAPALDDESEFDEEPGEKDQSDEEILDE